MKQSLFFLFAFVLLQIVCANAAGFEFPLRHDFKVRFDLKKNASACSLEILNAGAQIVYSGDVLGFVPRNAEECRPTNFNISAPTAATEARNLLAFGVNFYSGADYRRHPSTYVVELDESMPLSVVSYSDITTSGGGVVPFFILFRSAADRFMVSDAGPGHIRITSIDWTLKKVIEQSQQLDCGYNTPISALEKRTLQGPDSDGYYADPAALMPIKFYVASMNFPDPDFSLSFNQSLDGFKMERFYEAGCGIHN